MLVDYMPMTKEQVLAEVLQWSDSDREELLVALDESLHGESSDEISDAWKAEIVRRVEDIEAGRATLYPADQVFDELRAELRNARND
ncbi:MAG: addiction module protein [Verrucomicrobiota bacterium JB022]|nr:addiction module protein [Verrucomicrobiota bacterium JB022]